MTILGVSPDEPARLAEWRTAEDLPYHLLSDPDHAVAELYSAWGEKSMYGKKYMGIERTTCLIDTSGNIKQIWNKVKVKEHAEAVLQEVQKSA